MKLLDCKFLSQLAGWMGVASLSVLISLPAGAQGVLNPNPSIFNEPPYNRGRRTAPADVTPSTPTPEETTTPAPESPSAGSGQDVLTLAEKNGSFKTLTAAIRAAGLTNTLQGAGPFTVFAPTDAAFAELPQDALQELLKPENKAVLVKILTYHVVPGQVLSSDLKSGDIKSVEGGAINVKVDSSGVMVNEAKVLQPDIKASNGVIHVIDKVILPSDI